MFLYYVGFTSRAIKNSEVSAVIENFAYLGSWNTFLSDLAAMAMPEHWDFDGTTNNYAVLCQYIKYTFFRLTKENKICISDDGTFAAFNTGLLTPRYEDIFACFQSQENTAGTGWRYTGFCTQASGTLGKQLVNKLRYLPEPAEYFKNFSEVYFDRNKLLMLDYYHILVDNISRFPIGYLKTVMHTNGDACEILRQIESASDADKYDLFEELKDIVANASDIFMRLQSDLKQAADLAAKMAARDYRMVVPCYFPKGDKVTMMLPLYLQNRESPDVALVVELTDSGNYQGQTILTMEQAYIDARLISRLEGNWVRKPL